VKTSLQLEVGPQLKFSQNCSLCGQEISGERQMPLNTIIIEGYGMCPNCCQHVCPEIENCYSYRSRWLRHVQSITKKRGWDWQYRPGHGFERCKGR
jgi:hypothetical protein